MSQDSLAIQIQKSKSWVSKLESGDFQNPSYDALCSLVSTLDLDPRSLFPRKLPEGVAS